MNIIHEILERYKFEPQDQITLNGIQAALQNIAPGNYTVGWADDPHNFLMGIDLIFDDPQEKTLWLLKWT